MRDEAKTRLAGAAAALLTSVVLGVHQAGYLCTPPFSWKVLATLIPLFWTPYLSLTALLSRLPSRLSIPLFLVWLYFAAAPVAYALLIDLFTGHRVPGSQWYDAVWRVYAIVFLWMAIAVFNERIVKPWWRANSDRILAPFRSNSVASQARQLALDKRAQTLEGIKARVVLVLKKKKLAERAVEAKKVDLERVTDNITRVENFAKKAAERAESCAEAQREEAIEEMENVRAMVESAKRQGTSLHDDLKRAQLELEDIASQLEMLQCEWTDALHIQNYSSFYR